MDTPALSLEQLCSELRSHCQPGGGGGGSETFLFIPRHRSVPFRTFTASPPPSIPLDRHMGG